MNGMEWKLILTELTKHLNITKNNCAFLLTRLVDRFDFGI